MNPLGTRTVNLKAVDLQNFVLQARGIQLQKLHSGVVLVVNRPVTTTRLLCNLKH